MNILEAICEGPLNVNDISEALQTPLSTTAVNIKKLEDAGLISSTMVPGRGTQKLSSTKYDRIIIDLFRPDLDDQGRFIMEMPVGEYVDCRVEPTCGLFGDKGVIGIQDDPRTFFEPDRRLAQKLFFSGAGYVEYRFPNRLPYGCVPQGLEFIAEICSEAPAIIEACACSLRDLYLPRFLERIHLAFYQHYKYKQNDRSSRHPLFQFRI